MTIVGKKLFSAIMTLFKQQVRNRRKWKKKILKSSKFKIYPRTSVRHIVVAPVFPSTSVVGLPVYCSTVPPSRTPAADLMNLTATTMLPHPEVRGPVSPATGRRGKPDPTPCVHRPQLEAVL